MQNKSSKIVRLLAGIVIIVPVLAVIGYYGISYYIYDQLTVVQSACTAEFMEGKRDNTPALINARYRNDDDLVQITEYGMDTWDDITINPRGSDLELAGWFVPADEPTDYAVIVVHGFQSCKRDSTNLIPAGMLHDGGFDVLMFDLRNHGDSQTEDGRAAAGGREYQDVLGAYDYLLAQGYDADDIGLMGVSLGGATSIIAFGEEPQIPALWVDAPFSRIQNVVDNELSRSGFPTIFGAGALQVATWRGIPINYIPPVEALQNHNERPVYITHGMDDVRVPFSESDILLAVPGLNVTFLPFENRGHTESLYKDAAQYAAELNAFFREHLIDE